MTSEQKDLAFLVAVSILLMVIAISFWFLGRVSVEDKEYCPPGIEVEQAAEYAEK